MAPTRTTARAIGFHASHEQFDPARLLRLAAMAEQGGFAGLGCSDHFHPWSARQGNSGHAWSWLGAAMARTSLPTGVVTCPFGRYHPAVVAQAAASLQSMFPGRFWLAAGSGEALNEHITGRPWPGKARRNAMLKASVDVMRALWRGEEVDCRGDIVVDRARLYTLPPTPIPIFCAALSEETARWGGTWADGMITVSAAPARLRAIIDAFRASAGPHRPVYVQAKIAWAPPPVGEAAARRMAHAQWRTNVFGSDVCASLATPADFDALAATVRAEAMDRSVRISCDTGRHIAWIADDFDAGADAVLLHNVGTNQEAALEAFAVDVLPAFAGTACG